MKTAVYLLLVCGCAAAQTGPAMRGLYSDPTSFWKAGARLDTHGVNAVFVHAGSINAALVTRVHAEGAKLYAEFPTLNGKGYVESHPEAWPVDERGGKAPAATWFLGACPTDAGFRAWRMKQLEDLLDRAEVDGVWMDYLHWHAQFEDPKPVLPETCFSHSCILAFARETGVQVPQRSTAEAAAWILKRHEREWRRWRTRVLAGWVADIRRVMERKRPGMLLGNYQCPWTDDDFDGARLRTLGLDVKLLAPLVDVMSPMVYHRRMGRPPEWVASAVEWLAQAVGGAKAPRIWPIVQAHDDPAAIAPAELATVLRLGGRRPATGVMIFTAGAVAKDPEKMRVVRDTYLNWPRE